MPPTRDAQDASKLSFPLQLVILVITTAISVALSVTGTTWSIRSDVRDVATRMELRDETYRKDQEDLKAQIRQLSARYEMLQVNMTELQLSLATRQKEK